MLQLKKDTEVISRDTVLLLLQDMLDVVTEDIMIDGHKWVAFLSFLWKLLETLFVFLSILI